MELHTIFMTDAVFLCFSLPNMRQNWNNNSGYSEQCRGFYFSTGLFANRETSTIEERDSEGKLLTAFDISCFTGFEENAVYGRIRYNLTECLSKITGETRFCAEISGDCSESK